MIERTWLCALPPLINDQNLKVSDLGATLANVATDFDLLREGIDKFQTSLRLTIEDVETGKTNFTKVRSALEDLESRIRHDLGATQLEAKLLNESFVRFESRIASAEAAHLEHATQFKDVSDRTAAAANLVREVEQSATASREHLNGLQQWVEQVDSSNQLAVKERAELREHVNGLQQWLEQVSNSREEIMKTAASIQRTVTEQHQSLIAQFENLRRSINTEILSIDTRQISDASFLKGQLSLQGRLIEIAGANKSRNGRLRNTGNKQDEEVASNHEYDAFYLAFEDRFRGSRSEIKERCRVYLPFLKRVPTSNKRGLLLDIGCGRGEWLELLTESKYTCASGVDLNVSMVELCRERRLDVTLVDGVKHLATLPGDKLTLIPAFHFIEHLGVRQLMKLLAEAHRVLKKGGLAIFETPNPQNILVGASDFYRDMTHSNPVHPDTIAFALESVGFTDVACYFLAAEKNGRKAIPQPDFRFDDLTAYVNVPRDFAVIARKA